MNSLVLKDNNVYNNISMMPNKSQTVKTKKDKSLRISLNVSQHEHNKPSLPCLSLDFSPADSVCYVVIVCVLCCYCLCYLV